MCTARLRPQLRHSSEGEAAATCKSGYGATTIFGTIRAGIGPFSRLPWSWPPGRPSSSPSLPQRGGHLRTVW
jgi:hypothetical protein